MELVTVKHGEPRTTTLSISEGTDNDHKSVIQLVRQYQNDFEEFGTLAFEMRKSGGRPTEYASLNEPQATLLFTYMRNTDVVRDFKKRIVKAFMTCRKQKQHGTLPPVVREFTAAKQLAKALGLTGNQAILSANKAVHNITGMNCIEYMGATHLLTSAKQEARFNPTQLGTQIGLTAQQVNRMLAQIGLQYRNPDTTHELRWILTDEGKKYGEYVDMNKSSLEGKSLQGIAWYESVLDQLNNEKAE